MDAPASASDEVRDVWEYIADEEAEFEQVRAQAHKLMAAALPGNLKITIKSADGEKVIGTIRSLSTGTWKEPIIVGKPGCHECGAQLVPALDVYYGKDPRGTNHCVQCRREMNID